MGEANEVELHEFYDFMRWMEQLSIMTTLLGLYPLKLINGVFRAGARLLEHSPQPPHSSMRPAQQARLLFVGIWQCVAAHRKNTAASRDYPMQSSACVRYNNFVEYNIYSVIKVIDNFVSYFILIYYSRCIREKGDYRKEMRIERWWKTSHGL